MVTLTFWRPQRPRIEGEPGQGEWMDVGNLAYAAAVTSSSPNAPGGVCPQSSYSSMDPNLIPDPASANSNGPPTFGGIRFLDLSGDQPSNPANTFTYTLNLTDCLASKGLTMSTTQPTNAIITAFTATPNGGAPAMASSTVQFQLQP